MREGKKDPHAKVVRAWGVVQGCGLEKDSKNVAQRCAQKPKTQKASGNETGRERKVPLTEKLASDRIQRSAIQKQKERQKPGYRAR